MLSAFGVAAAVSAYSAGAGAKYIPQLVFVYAAIIVGLGITLFMIFWPREPNYWVVFEVAVALGISEGAINAVAPGNAPTNVTGAIHSL